MAIKGDFKDINITDIIQLIARDRKTGCLSVHKQDIKIKIYFFEGKILFADNENKALIMAQRLMKAGFLTKEQLKNIQREQKKSKKLIYELMIKMDYLDFDSSRNILFNQIIEDIYSVFLWTDGYYQFEATNNIPHKDFKIEIDPDTLLFDAARVLDEWKRAKQQIVNEEVILEKKELEDTSIDTFSPEEKKIYGLINGNFTVNEIIEQSLLSQFDVYLILSNFIEKDIICQQRKKSGVRRKFKFDFYIPYIHWESLFQNLLFLLIILLLIFSSSINISFVKILWNRITDNTVFLEIQSNHSSSTMADQFYRLEYGPWTEEDLRNIK
ncbi:MAG: DUF4388 domain-containing protein [bacterium]